MIPHFFVIDWSLSWASLRTAIMRKSTKVNKIGVGLFSLWCMAANAQQTTLSQASPLTGVMNESVAARCAWGKGIAGLAQEKMLAGISRREFLVSLDQLHYSRAWMPRMTQAIADNIYRSSSTSSSSIVQERYLNDCQQYYLAK
ncbi:hypothetical protein [Pseudomonas sp. KNUC1026]|uniref:hypothetical protein n=1 Tax=Pseudomonas sp. KNUC1026 TaxID=2893890 RepID=UPI001F16BE19|nr:hypothetical protein [Pseudomonas sp. KNUC1026]UFH48273.1 hypothetical protein LN139_13975 [Pseudomonas sp. KNUC1026]